jgi:hypothetical protein
MRIKELRDFFNKVPESMDEFQIVYRRFEDEEDNVLFLDYPITTLYIDEENQEGVFLDEDGWDFFNNNLLSHEDDETDSDI